MPKRYGLHFVKNLPQPNDTCFCGSEKEYVDCCQMCIVHDVGDGSMRILTIAGVEIYRPKTSSDVAIRFKAEPALRQHFRPGVYKELKDAQAILHQQVEFFGAQFDSLIPQLASRDLLKFVLWQYDKTGELDDLHRADNCTAMH